jgi:hypothetical protein
MSVASQEVMENFSGEERSLTERVVQLVVGRDDRVSWDDDDQALTAHAGWAELRREFDRSRRFGRAFTLMRMDRIHHDGARDVDLVRTLPARLRGIDSVWAVGREVFVLLPEAQRDVGVALVARLRRESPGLLPANVRLAAFPSDGTTVGALLKLLDKAGRPDDSRGLDVVLPRGLAPA